MRLNHNILRHLISVVACGFISTAEAADGLENAISSKPGVDVEAWLKDPSVRFLAVQFHANNSPVSVEDVAAWKSLKRRYGSHGLRVVVVTGLHPGFSRRRLRAPRCEHPGWQPDAYSCDVRGYVAAGLGVTHRPSAFLWSWPGNLLVQAGRPAQIESALQAEISRVPHLDKSLVPWQHVEIPIYAMGDPREYARTLSQTHLDEVTDPRAQRMVAWLQRRLGTPYKKGGTGGDGYDDWAMIQALYREVYGMDIGGSRREQLTSGPAVPIDLRNGAATLQPGDLIFYLILSKIPRRVAIYLGNGKMAWVYMVKGVSVQPIPTYMIESYYIYAVRPLSKGVEVEGEW